MQELAPDNWPDAPLLPRKARVMISGDRLRVLGDDAFIVHVYPSLYWVAALAIERRYSFDARSITRDELLELGRMAGFGMYYSVELHPLEKQCSFYRFLWVFSGSPEDLLYDNEAFKVFKPDGKGLQIIRKRKDR